MPNINKNIIMQAGAAVANATNKAAGLSASTPEPGSIISAIQLVNGGRTIGPAALAHFAESVRNKLLSLLVTMEPIQDLHGYSSPWPGGGGVNKCNVSDLVSNGTMYGLLISFDGDWVVLSGTYSNTSTSASARIFHKSNNSGFANLKYFPDSASKAHFTSYSAGRADSNRTATLFINNMVDGTQYNLRFRVVEYEGSTAPTAWTPYSNICPITGRTGLNVYAGPSDSIGDAATYSMDWTTPAGTIYGGNADIVTGDIKAAPYYASYNGETLVGPWISSMDAYDPEGTPTTGAQVVDMGGTMTEYHITGQDIITLVGDNYIWSDSGDVTITE